MANRHQSDRQKQLRKKRHECAFLFDSTMANCLAEVERDEWEWAIEMAGGNVSEAAVLTGINNIPRNARALWGRSPAQALDCYRQWTNQKATRK
ncbi:MAG: hypothetical protein HY537_15645 [Deltaproteobacteria bacterium]|nr:hypothetical protein [Deltaproteobacteria bacterium]